MNGTHRVDQIEKERPDKLEDNNLGVNKDTSCVKKKKMIVGRKANTLKVC